MKAALFLFTVVSFCLNAQAGVSSEIKELEAWVTRYEASNVENQGQSISVLYTLNELERTPLRPDEKRQTEHLLTRVLLAPYSLLVTSSALGALVHLRSQIAPPFLHHYALKYLAELNGELTERTRELGMTAIRNMSAMPDESQVSVLEDLLFHPYADFWTKTEAISALKAIGQKSSSAVNVLARALFAPTTQLEDRRLVLFSMGSLPGGLSHLITASKQIEFREELSLLVPLIKELSRHESLIAAEALRDLSSAVQSQSIAKEGDMPDVTIAKSRIQSLFEEMLARVDKPTKCVLVSGQQ